MICAENLKKIYTVENIETHAVKNINLNIKQGEFVSVMGPSGCGKTTLLNLLGLLVKPSGGRYLLLGKDVSRFTEAEQANLRKGNIGFVFQSYNLIDELNVFENVELPLVYLKLPARQRKEKVMLLLEQMNMAHRRNYFPQQLSGGQQQRVALARAVIADPKLILADEPTGNLDSVNGERVMQLLSRLHQKGTTIVMVTHSKECAQQADRIISLFDGQIIGHLA
jgi:putative ABC transport system ATP-binding protein